MSLSPTSPNMKEVSMASKKRDHITYNKSLKRYQARYMVTLPNGVRKRQAVYGKTESEAREKYNKAVAESIIGNPIQTSNITLEQYLTQWVESAKKIRESTRSGYKSEIRKFIVPNIGKVRLSQLTTYHIQSMMNKVQREGASVRTTYILRNILSKALKLAEAQSLVKRDIIKYVELDTYRPKERVVWSEEEGQVFLEAIRGHKYQLFFALYMTYGLRRGEAIPLTWGDIDFSDKTIQIDKQYTYHGEKLVLSLPKTDKSIRVLPLLPHIEDILVGIKERQEPSKDSLIVSTNGELVKPSSIEYEFKRLIKQNHLTNVALHSLRHFVATQLKNANVTIKDAQEILGHSSPLTTMQFYQHSDMASKREALAKYAEKMQF